MERSKYVLHGFFTISVGICLFLLSNTLYAQSYGTGLKTDENKYEKVPMSSQGMMKGDSGEKISLSSTQPSTRKLQPSFSLKKYCPSPGNQFNTATCVGWATAYGARTILEAIANKWDNTFDQAIINENAFSPSFIYNQILAEKSDPNITCDFGAYLYEALTYLRDKGTVKIRDFPFYEDCNITPNIDLVLNASNYKIVDYNRLTFTKEDGAKVKKVQHSLSTNTPIVVAMKILRNFKYGDHSSTNYVWDPTRGDTADDGAHALTVIGYDDEKGHFELMNSWGTDWANNGFIYISYADFNKYVKEVFQVLYDSNAAEVVREPLVMREKVKSYAVSASLGFKQMATEGVGEDSNCVPGLMTNMNVSKKGNTYKMANVNTPWTSYQIHLTPHIPNIRVYAFSFDQKGGADLLFPFDENLLSLYGDDETHSGKSSDLLAYSDVAIAIPHPDYCMQLDDKAGTVNCFLFTKQKLNIDKVLHDVRFTSGTLEQRLQKILGNKLVHEKNIKYRDYGVSKKINFESLLKEDAILPIIVDMNHVK